MAARFFNHLLNESRLSPEGFRDNRFSTLISSSRSGQWIASLFPISRQLLRSSGVPCKSLGYHARGTEIDRPSFRSTVKLSAVITIFCAISTPTTYCLLNAVLSINVTTVGNGSNYHGLVLIVDSVKDPIVTDSYSPLGTVYKFCRAGRAWII